MADFSGTTTVASSPDALFAYLSDVGHLPEYFARMTSASPGEAQSGEGRGEVRTTARMPDGQEVQGDAWFRVDRSARTLEWGSEGPSEYAGRLAVRPSGDGSEVEVRLHTTRVEDGDAEVQDGISETLAAIKDRGEALPASP